LRTNMGRKADEYIEDHEDPNTVVEDTDTDTDSLSSSLRRRGRILGGIGRVREWRNHENDLTQTQRGFNQVKAVRTSGWMKDNLMGGLNAFQDRFRRHDRATKMEKEIQA